MGWPRIIRRIRSGGSLRSLARWLFLSTLIATPWLYGATTAVTVEIVNAMLGVVMAVWIASLLVDRRWPMMPRELGVIAAVILLLGWWMVANAHAVYDPTFRAFAPVRAILPRVPGSVDYILSFDWMVRTSVLLGVVCLVSELAQRPVWLLRLWAAIVVAGGSIALLGLIQKGTGARMIFWQPLAAQSDFYTFFATYYYHANAGAFLNLVLPFGAGLVLWTTARHSSSPWARAASLTTFVFLIVATFSNTSRMAQLVSAGLIVAIIATMARPVFQMAARAERKMLILGFVLVVITLAAVAQAAHLDQPWRRWQSFTDQFSANARWLANRAAFAAVRDAGWFGFGPGTFRAIFPQYQERAANLQGTWRFLHEDYLQTLLEWGWLGTLAIGALFFGGIGFAIRNHVRSSGWSNRQHIILICAVLALVGVAVHAAVDFPLQILSLQLFAATCLGICWGSSKWKSG
jgi:hypothetical protein